MSLENLEKREISSNMQYSYRLLGAYMQYITKVKSNKKYPVSQAIPIIKHVQESSLLIDLLFTIIMSSLHNYYVIM